MAKNLTPDQLRAKRERYRTNKAARQGGESHSTDAGRPHEQQIEGGQHVAGGSIAGHRHGVISGPYNAEHLRPRFPGDDPGLLAARTEPWEHLLPLWGSHERRQSIPVAVQCHWTYVQAWSKKRSKIRTSRRGARPVEDAA